MDWKVLEIKLGGDWKILQLNYEGLESTGNYITREYWKLNSEGLETNWKRNAGGMQCTGN